jgi:hypothetical protein
MLQSLRRTLTASTTSSTARVRFKIIWMTSLQNFTRNRVLQARVDRKAREASLGDLVLSGKTERPGDLALLVRTACGVR